MITRRHRTALGDSILDYLTNAFNGGRLTPAQIQSIAQQTANQVIQAGGTPQQAQAAANEVATYATGANATPGGVDLTQIPAIVENAVTKVAQVAGGIAGAAKTAYDNSGTATAGAIAGFTGLNLLLLAGGAFAIYKVLSD